MTKLLELKNVSKTFPGVKALSNVHLDRNAGEVLGLCGENGAGKSTLMKILTGIYTPDPGAEIWLQGKWQQSPRWPWTSARRLVGSSPAPTATAGWRRSRCGVSRTRPP